MDEIENHEINQVNKIFINDYNSEAMVEFENKFGFETGPIGYMINESAIFNSANCSIKNSIANKSIDIDFCNDKFTTSKNFSDGQPNIVECESNRKFSARLLIGADGSNSSVGKCITSDYMPCSNFSFDQYCIVATLTHSRAAKESFYWQKFLPDGNLAFLPLGDQKSSLAWCIKASDKAKFENLSKNDMIESINKAMIVI